METGMEKYLKEKMDDALLEELMPDFDKEREWDMLAQKLHPKKKMFFVPVWARAAAVLLLVASGWLLLYNRDNAEVINGTAVTITKLTADKKALQPVGIIPAKDKSCTTTAVASNAVSIPEYKHSKRQPVSIVPLHDSALQIVLQADARPIPTPTDSMPNIAAPNLPPTQVAVKKPRPQAIHILDVDNEDRKFMINEEYKGNPIGIIARLQNMLVPNETVAATDIPNPSQIILKR